MMQTKKYMLELSEGIADEYLRLSKSKGDLIMLQIFSSVLQKQIEDESSLDSPHSHWIKYCIWQAIYTSYHKLFADAAKAIEDIKINKHKMNPKEYLKNAPRELKDYHEKILLVRHQYFVHGGTNLFEKYKLFANIQHDDIASKIQLTIEGRKEPEINDNEIDKLNKLLIFLLGRLSIKIKHCETRILEGLHKAVEKTL